MSDDKERTLPYGLDPSKIAPASSQEVDITTLKKVVNIVKKSPFQRHKEELEKRKKRDQEEAKQVYEEFIATFSVDPKAPKAKTFVKGEVIVPTESGLEVKKESAPKIYKPEKEILQSSKQNSSPPPTNTTKDVSAEPPKPTQQGKKKRNIDEFMEELKRQQDERDRKKQKVSASSARASNSGAIAPLSREDVEDELLEGDTQTSNLYIGNLTQNVTEEILRQEFGKFGPIVSVKVMWPRSQEEKRRPRNCGFVQFFSRSDAERAKDALNGKELFGVPMQVGWGRLPRGRPKGVVPPPWIQSSTSPTTTYSLSPSDVGTAAKTKHNKTRCLRIVVCLILPLH